MARRPSSLVDTRVIYCGDCLDQLRKMPEGCVDLIYIKTRPGQLNPSFVTRSWDGKSEITVLSICSTATSRSRRAFVDASLLPNAESRFASSNSRFTRRRSRGLEGAQMGPVLKLFDVAGTPSLEARVDADRPVLMLQTRAGAFQVLTAERRPVGQ